MLADCAERCVVVRACTSGGAAAISDLHLEAFCICGERGWPSDGGDVRFDAVNITEEDQVAFAR
jgi:hypothetical protein